MAFSAAHYKTPATFTYSKSRQDADLLDPADVISVPNYSRWYSRDEAHKCEERYLPEFFDGRSPSKNPEVYKYYRNAMVRSFRDNPTRRISFTEFRKSIIGDVGSIRRVLISSKLGASLTTSHLLLSPLSSQTPPPLPPEMPLPLPTIPSRRQQYPEFKKRVCSDCKCKTMAPWTHHKKSVRALSASSKRGSLCFCIS